MTMTRHHMQFSGQAEDILREALHLSRKLLQSRRADIMGLAVHTKFQSQGSVREVLGDEAVTGLDRNNRVHVKGITIQLLTEKIQVRKLDGPVVAAFVSVANLDKIIGCQGVTDLVFVPRENADLQAYEAAFPESIPVHPMHTMVRPAAGMQEA